MKTGLQCTVGVTLFLSCLVAAAVAQNCGNYADTLAHPTDCTKYYEIREFACPEGLFFNKATKLCDLPECGAGETTLATTTTTEPTTTEPTTTTTEPTTTTTEPTTTTTEPTTTTTEPTTTTTEPTTTTTEPTTTTTEPTTTTTEPTTTTTEITEHTTTETPLFTEEPTTTGGTTIKPEGKYCPPVEDPNNKIRYPHETNCNYYYLCQQGALALYTCLTDNHFNPMKRICNPINEAGCDRCPTVEVPDVVVRLPHETVCQYYYKCIDSIATLYQCSTGLHFSRDERTCLNKGDAYCTLLEQAYMWL